MNMGDFNVAGGDHHRFASGTEQRRAPPGVAHACTWGCSCWVSARPASYRRPVHSLQLPRKMNRSSFRAPANSASHCVQSIDNHHRSPMNHHSLFQ